MAFNKMTTNVENVSALPDVVSEQSSLLKNTFDKAGKDLKAFINTHIDELGSETSASNLGATKEGVATTVQEYLDDINNNLGDKTEITVNGEKQKEVSIYAPTTSGNVNQILRGNENGEPQWAEAPEGIVVDSTLSETSTNAIQNKAVAEALKNVTSKIVVENSILTEGWIEDTHSLEGETITQYYYDMPVEGLLQTDIPHITPKYTGFKWNDEPRQEAWNKISRAESISNEAQPTGYGTLRFYCFEETPTVEIPIQIEIVR